MNISCKELLKHKNVAVAVSGGKDSIALLHYLYSNVDALSIKSLVAVNVEHGIRGEESKKDTLFVKEFCDKLNIKCYLYSVDAISKKDELGLSLEETARLLRYNCLYDLKNKGLCDVICTAHHKSDNTESVLFNIMRGSSLKGLSGIPAVKDGFIIRPFLGIDKEVIDKYITNFKLPYVTDATNFSTDYTRNYLRIEILPKLKEKFNRLDDGIYRLSTLCRKEDEYLDKLAKNELILSDGDYLININVDEVLFLRAVVLALNGLGVKKDYEKKNVDAVYALTGAKNGDKLDVKQGVIAIKEYDYIRLYRNDNLVKKEETDFNLGTFTFSNGVLTVQKVLDDTPINYKLSKGVHYADLDKLLGAKIRFKNTGDVFTPCNGKSKKLKDYLIDKKIPQIKREGLPLIANGKEVLFIAGIEISDKIKVDGTTKNVVKLCYSTKEN